MSAREFKRWQWHHAKYPIDDESVHAAQIALLTSTVSNMFLGKGERTEASDFMMALQSRRKAEDAAPKNLDAKFIAFFRAVKPNPA